MKTTNSISNSALGKQFKGRKSISDRFIPQRNSITLYNFATMSRQEVTAAEDEETLVTKYQELLRANLTKAAPVKEKQHIFSYKAKKKKSSNNMTANRGVMVKNKRRSVLDIPGSPYKILEAPGLEDNLYLNLLDWSSDNKLAVCLSNSIYVLDISTQAMTKVYEAYDCESICSIRWNPDGTNLAIGNVLGQLAIWDVEKGTETNNFEHNTDRIASIDWNTGLLVGSRDTTISHLDLRTKTPVSVFAGHTDEVCKVSWSPDEKLFASGGSDNKLCVWSLRNSVSLMKETHNDCVKALDWSAMKYGILASGGGANDRTLNIWNTNTRELLSSKDTNSQICSLLFSKSTHDIITTHGNDTNEINIWKTKDLRKVGTLTGHTERVLYSAISPCGNDLLSASADETLRFWTLYNDKSAIKTKRESLMSMASSIR